MILRTDNLKMEKYIFDGRSNLHNSPKYLKRNQTISMKHHSTHLQENKIFNNKVFVTFDYSYYGSIIPKTSNMQKENRIYNLELVLEHDTPDSQKLKERKIQTQQNQYEERKWKKNYQSFQEEIKKKRQSELSRFIKRKTKKPVTPGVGDYEIENKKIRKKIVYDIKIRGKPKDFYKFENLGIKNENISQKNEKKMQSLYPNEMKASSKGLQERNEIRKLEEENERFMNQIDGKNVWNRLMKKHKLKGSKFDVFIQ